MNQKSTFNRNLDSAIMNLMNCKESDCENFMFKLNPIREIDFKESSKDDWMRLAVLPNNQIHELKEYKDVIRLLSAGNSNYPLWAKVSKISEQEIQIDFSLRFRHIKTSHNQETGHPPFKVVI